MAKKRPSLKDKQAAGRDQPQFTIEDLSRLLDAAIKGGVSDQGQPAQQPAIIQPQGGAGMTPFPIQPDPSMGGGGMNAMPMHPPPAGPPSRGFASLMPPSARVH